MSVELNCPTRPIGHPKRINTMLNETEKATALKIVLASHDPEEFGAVNDRLCDQFPNITTDDLIALYREAAERQLAEAEELERFAQARGRQ